MEENICKWCIWQGINLQNIQKQLLQLNIKKNKQPNKKMGWGFPGGAVVENLPANEGDTGSSPGLGSSHVPRSNWARAPQLLSLRSGACEPQLLSPCATTTEAHAPRARAPRQQKPP